MTYLPQGLRLLSLSINIATFYLIFAVLNNTWVPSPGGGFLWVVAGIGLWLVSLISAPWFQPPRDIFVSAITVLIALGTLVIPENVILISEVEILRWGVVIYASIILTLCGITMAIHDPEKPQGVNRSVMRMTESLGRGEVLFSGVALVSIFGFYADQYLNVVILVSLWFGFILTRPAETLLLACSSVWKLRADSIDGIEVGRIERVDHPNIVRVLMKDHAKWKQGTLYLANLPGGDAKYVIPLYSQIQGAQIVGTGLCCEIAEESEFAPKEGLVVAAEDQGRKERLLHDLSGGLTNSQLVGFVVEGSSIGSMRFEVAADAELEEGAVISCQLQDERIFFQILDAQTREENFQQNPRGTHIVTAGQVGSFDSQLGFRKHNWLPEMNQPVFQSAQMELDDAEFSDGYIELGTIPSTDGKVSANVDDLIEYHSAVLGVTGTGKTELALDLIRSAISQGAKVVCVDFTGEYAARLADLDPVDMGLEESAYEKLNQDLFAVDSGTYGAGEEKKVLKATLDRLAGGIETQMKSFLEDGDKLALLQIAEVFNNKATLRLTEIYLSSIMRWARSNRRKEKILVVLEEAHTIVPETVGAGFDFDTQWVVSRIGQIALQGRKYGVGLMLISQRTALVSKTILSQCNTFFVHSLIDQTSLNFLSSVVGGEYQKVIPNLRFLEFLAVGKAVSSERPVILQREFDQGKKDASDALSKFSGGAD